MDKHKILIPCPLYSKSEIYHREFSSSLIQKMLETILCPYKKKILLRDQV